MNNSSAAKKKSPHSPLAKIWATRWLESVASGVNTMSQRNRRSIENYGGGLNFVRRLAKERGVHLISLTDDQGNELVAASHHPFKVIC